MTRKEYRKLQQSASEPKDKPDTSNLVTVKPPKRHLIRHLFITILLACAGFFMLGTGTFFYYASSAPHITRTSMTNSNAIQFYDAQGHKIEQLGSHRDYIKYNNIPKPLVNGLTSIEDRHFFTNNGVDPARILEAEVQDVRGHGNNIQGGSTLTQQLVKLSVFSTNSKDRTLKRKAQEAWLALRVNKRFSKQHILEYYINKVYMGHGSYGMETASQYYFNKPLQQLKLYQLALLSGLPQSPVAYDPYTHSQLATNRRDQVLIAMYKNHKINRPQEQQALHTPVTKGLVHRHNEDNEDNARAKIASDYIQQSMDELKSKNYNLHGGLKVYTNLNMKDQTQMYNLANHSSKPGWPDKKFQVGSALVNAHNGAIQAEIGGRKQTTVFGLNRANQTTHSNGSTNKPLMDYGPAFQYLGYTPDQTVEDTPFYYPGTHIKLEDFDHHYKGAMSLRSALVQSRNVPAIKALQAVHVQRARHFMDGLGLPTVKSQTSLQNGIGGYISPIQEAAAYAAFANGGVYHQPLEVRKIVDNTGKVHYLHSHSDRAMSKHTAYEMDDVLKGVPNSDDGDHANVPGLHEAGKTGTTQFPTSYKYHLPNYAAMDSWYEGYTPNQSMSVWTGYDHPLKPDHYITANGINIAQRYYKYVMELAAKEFPDSNW